MLVLASLECKRSRQLQAPGRDLVRCWDLLQDLALREAAETRGTVLRCFATACVAQSSGCSFDDGRGASKVVRLCELGHRWAQSPARKFQDPQRAMHLRISAQRSSGFSAQAQSLSKIVRLLVKFNTAVPRTWAPSDGFAYFEHGRQAKYVDLCRSPGCGCHV